MNRVQPYLNIVPHPSLVLILYAMQPADSSQPSIFTPLSFSADTQWEAYPRPVIATPLSKPQRALGPY